MTYYALAVYNTMSKIEQALQTASNNLSVARMAKAQIAAQLKHKMNALSPAKCWPSTVRTCQQWQRGLDLVFAIAMEVFMASEAFCCQSEKQWKAASPVYRSWMAFTRIAEGPVKRHQRNFESRCCRRPNLLRRHSSPALTCAACYQ